MGTQLRKSWKQKAHIEKDANIHVDHTQLLSHQQRGESFILALSKAVSSVKLEVWTEATQVIAVGKQGKAGHQDTRSVRKYLDIYYTNICVLLPSSLPQTEVKSGRSPPRTLEHQSVGNWVGGI